MKFNEITYILSFGILIITALYTLIYAGLTGLLLCSSISLIIAAFVNQFEIVVAITVLVSLFYIYFIKRLLKKVEPFNSTNNNTKNNTFNNPLNNARKEPFGVYESFIEGFETVSNDEKEGESSKSSNASTKMGNGINPDALKKITEAVTAKTDTTKTDSAKQGKQEKKQGFKDANEEEEDADKGKKEDKKKLDFKNIEKEEFQSATNELFKLGKMPSEHAEGPLLDAGSTLLKAMSSFKPEQITAMSSDTKQLLETQKNLMGMLNQMRPVLADGRELLNTFSGMFGNN